MAIDLRALFRRTLEARRRLALGAAVGAFASVALAALDAYWARKSGEATYGVLVLADAGLTAPLGLLVGTVTGAASAFAHPEQAPTPARLIARLRDAGSGRHADRAAFVVACALAAFAWLVAAAHLARLVLAAPLPPRLAGLGIAAGAFVLGIVCAFAVLVATPSLRRALAIAQPRVRAAIDPAATLTASLALVAIAFGYGVWSGGLSGEGGLLGIFGVFKRQELDLRAPAMLGAVALAAYFGPALLPRLRHPVTAAAVALLPLGLTVHAAGALEHAPDAAAALERGGPLARLSLPVLRRLTDRDHDGAAAYFGGGDCNDRDPNIAPSADDIPGNGVDEDCSGSDLSAEAVAAARPATSHAAAPPPAAASRLPKDGNVVLITVDTLRHDLGYTGYARAITPSIDALAKRSVVFERAYSLASYTGKSVGPMLIGKYGSETHRNWGHFNKFSSEDTFLAERALKAGIHTISVQGHHYFGRFGGLERGFEVLDLSAAPPETAKWAEDSTVTGDKLTAAAVARIEEAGKAGQPFFAWVHYLDPHADYLKHPDVTDFGSSARDMYDNEVAYTDQQLGHLLDAIAAAPWGKKTTVILTSDHGEAFGEHDMWRHGFELWEVLVHVPLIVHVPGIAAQSVSVRRSLIDLVPTVMELLGLPAPTGEGDDFVSGQSLLSDVLAPAGAEHAVRDILVDMPAGPYNEARRAFIHDDLKLVISRDASKELFDLAADPGEKKNLWRTRKGDIEAPYAAAKAALREIKVTSADK